MKISKNESLVWGGLLILFGALSIAENFFDINAWLWFVGLAAGGAGVFAVYSKDKSEISLLIISYVLISVALLIALTNLNVLQGEFTAAYILSVIAAPFIYGYFRSDRKNWGLLIPAYALLAVAIMLLLIGFNALDGILVASFVNFAVAVPFFYIYFNNKQHWWALIPGGVTAVVAFSFMLASSVKFVGPAALIIVGIMLIVRQLSSKDSE
jgi:hypothetical protein